MKSLSLKLFGRRLVNRAAENQNSRFHLLNPRLGLSMMLDLEVPLRPKFQALVFGVAIALALIFLEIPLTLALAAIPGVGLVFDLLVDGAEALVAPILFACTLLPRLVGPDILAKYAAEAPLAAIDPDIPHVPIDPA
jgi:hypothetical protein